ncbi:radical SAM protein [Candidatus Woesearchaeota archaeon]|nr:radical SAM protein [Candidatus Woesearchaeota archaeon]
MDDLHSLMQQAQLIYRAHFPMETNFERALFFSWGCTIGDCVFCYMSTQPAGKKPTETKRSISSIFAESLLVKHLHWDVGFVTGGIGVLKPDELEFLLKGIYEIVGEKLWLSVGPIPKPLLERYLPYIKGIVGSTETVNPVLHKKVCPSKPLAPYEKMFELSKQYSLKRAMTFIVGMGETHEDFPLLVDFIKKHDIHKIHLYGLIPTKGTIYEHTPPPTKEEQAWWIAQLRIAVPTLDIQAGIWDDRAESVSFFLQAGANSISKFQAVKFFGSEVCRQIVAEAKNAGRTFSGNLLTMPSVDWDAEIERLSFSGELKVEIRKKLDVYLKQMGKHGAKHINRVVLVND